ncbi:uncharacterized protein LOC143348273 [Colletes latitarsis]|uniref:uncharacterized protein LOC143348273 n=1 Tax=Colletes latitarsis TaxID=2605962 RepID=UPI004035437C
MERKLVDIKHFTFFVLFLLITRVRLQDLIKGNIGNNNYRACAYLQCENDDACVHRKFRCKDPPCPSMLYCAKSRTESLRGPSTCNSVRCSRGYVCMLKVRRCRWDEKCKQQIARCVSRKEYHEGPASCAGFECPQGSHCILRESFCVSPPCKLLRSCAKNKEVHVWFGKCRSLTCQSEFECFLRRPEDNCSNSNTSCKHVPDCVSTEETTNEHCRGWICPRMQKCSVKVMEPCDTNDCKVRRTCDVELQNYSSPFSRRSLNYGDQRTVPPETDAKVPSDTSQGNVNETTKMPHPWLNHLNSKTELDAIELWIQNAQGQRDFKQFQDWLRSIEDGLGSSAYSAWIEETLASTSRGEELRKWLRASIDPRPLDIDNIDKKREKPIIPGLERPQNDVTRSRIENRFPVHDKLKPVYKEEILPRQLPTITNTNGQSYYMVPVENVEGPGNPQPIDHDFESRRVLQNDPRKISDNNDASKGQKNNFFLIVPETFANLSFDKEEPPPLWIGMDENFSGKSFQNERHFVEYGVTENKTSLDETRYSNDISMDFIEKLIKNLPVSSLENIKKALDHKFAQQNHKHNSNKNYDSSTATDTHDYEDLFTNKNSTDNVSSYAINVTNNFEPKIIDTSDKLDEDNDTVDLNLFFELNKETLLPYIQSLMEAMDQGEDPSNNSEPNTDESLVKHALVEAHEFQGVEITPYESKASTMESKNISPDDDSPDNTDRDRNKQISSIIDPQQEKDPGTHELIYQDKDAKSETFYDIPSYGLGDDVEDYVHEDDRISHVKGNEKQSRDDRGSTIDRGK